MNYAKQTVKQLKTLCKEQKIKGISGKNKKVLIDLLQNKTVDVPWEDMYTPELLINQYNLHKDYVKGRIASTKKLKVRLPSIPEDISENIIKQTIRNKLKDTSCTWDCKNGDLHSEQEGKQECKCFTSDGPSSFTPSSEWDVIYFLDATKWLENEFILYRVNLKKSSNEWKNIKVNKNQTFEDQCKEKRRPRINWSALKPQIESFCKKVYEGTFEDIFIPVTE